MNLIKPSYEIWEQPQGINGMYKHIERAGRVCYKSEERIKEDSAEPFVKSMIKSQHYAMLEHATVYLHFDMYSRERYFKYCYNPYSVANSTGEAEHDTWNGYVTSNYRVIIEHGWEDDLKYLCESTEHHEKRVTVHFVSDIHFYKDITRHRVFSYAIESTRFCNYLRDKFGCSVNFATPIWLKDEEKSEFEEDLKTLENLYFKWINKGWKPQQAAYFLAQGTKADAIMTGFVKDFKHFFDLRTSIIASTGQPHPTVAELADPLYNEFIKRGLINPNN